MQKKVFRHFWSGESLIGVPDPRAKHCKYVEYRLVQKSDRLAAEVQQMHQLTAKVLELGFMNKMSFVALAK